MKLLSVREILGADRVKRIGPRNKNAGENPSLGDHDKWLSRLGSVDQHEVSSCWALQS